MKKIIPALFISLFMVSSFLSYSYMEGLKRNDALITKLQAYNRASVPTIKREATQTGFIISKNEEAKLIKKIDDYVGWITINDTPIDYPVVRGIDNIFYLDHNYLKENSKAGAIFMDRRNIGSGYDQHTLIYGHNMKNGTMFNTLNKYLDKNFWQSHKTIHLRNLYFTDVYEIVSVYNVSADTYEVPLAIDTALLQAYLDRSVHDTGYIPSGTEKVLTLVTCNYQHTNGG